MVLSARIDIVRSTIWAQELTEAEIQRASGGVTERTFLKGSYICYTGDRLDYWTGLISGLVKVGAISSSGKEMTFAGLTSGAWFGEGSVLKDEPRQYDVVALRDTQLLMLNRVTFFWLYENSTGFNRFLVRHLNERVGQFISTIIHDRILSPTARVARSLAFFFNPVLYPQMSNSIDILQEELALLAGLSRQATNRVLQTLEADGCVQLEHGRIVVIDLPRLKHFDE